MEEKKKGGKRAAPANRLGHKIGIITALRLLYHVREAAWYNCPSKGGCRASGEPLGIRRYNNRRAVIIPCYGQSDTFAFAHSRSYGQLYHSRFALMV